MSGRTIDGLGLKVLVLGFKRFRLQASEDLG